MATMLLQTNITQGNYEQVFAFTLDASLGGIAGDIDDAKIQIFFPLNIEVFLNPPTSPVKSISEQQTQNGKIVTFDIGKIEDLGIALKIEFGAKFSLESKSGDTFVCTPELIINGQVQQTASAQIQLLVEGNFVVTRKIVLPENPCAGSEVYYEVLIENIGDKWAALSIFDMQILGNENLTLDSAYEVLGKDISPSAYSDKSADETAGVFTGNSLSFSFFNYRGTKYRFFYKTLVNQNLSPQTQIAAAANYTIDEQTFADEGNFVLAEQSYSANISLYGPQHTLAGEFICYETNLQNSGNRVLENSVFTCELPQNCDYYEFRTGLFYLGAIGEFVSSQYTLEYETSSGSIATVGTFNINQSSNVDISGFIEQGERLLRLIWRFGDFGIGLKTLVPPRIKGTVLVDVPTDTQLYCTSELAYSSVQGSGNAFDDHTTLVADICTLVPRFSSSKNNSNLRPLEEIRFTIGANCVNSRIKNPVFAVLLPSQFEYIGVQDVRYSDIFEDVNPPLPPAIVIQNFDATSQTLVKFEFTGEYAYSFNQKCIINIFINARVRIGALGTAQSFSVLNCDTQSDISGATYINDNISSLYSSTYAKSSEKTNLILFTASVRADNKVRGSSDALFVEEPIVANTYEGGGIVYKLSVTNIGNATFDRVEIVNILPHIGDVGVISNAQRGSEFSIYNIAEISVLGGEFSVYYSQSYDPVRFSSTFGTIGSVDDWSKTPPDDITKLKSFKVVSGQKLFPAETLEVLLFAVAPSGTRQSLVAWNSFSALLSYTDAQGISQQLLPIEPEKVGVSVQFPPNSGSIGGFVWLDEDMDGLFSEGETFVDEVGVALYDENEKIVSGTFTTPNAQGVPGQYLINNIPDGRYFLRFFIDERTYKFTIATEGGSGVNSKGVSGFFEVDGSKLTLSSGIRGKNRHTISEILAVNNSARGMLRNVIKNEMLIVMKQEDVLSLLDK